LKVIQKTIRKHDPAFLPVLNESLVATLIQPTSDAGWKFHLKVLCIKREWCVD